MHDGQFAQASHAEIARRVEMSQHETLRRRANQDDPSAHPVSLGGALRAIVTTREAGMRWPRDVAALLRRCGRTMLLRTRSRSVLTPRCWCPRSAHKRIVAMVANKPGAPGRLRISVKTIAQGMPECSALPVVPAACIFFAGGPWVRPSPGIPCALRL